jgi:hypothetical protein
LPLQQILEINKTVIAKNEDLLLISKEKKKNEKETKIVIENTTKNNSKIKKESLLKNKKTKIEKIEEEEEEDEKNEKNIVENKTELTSNITNNKSIKNNIKTTNNNQSDGENETSEKKNLTQSTVLTTTTTTAKNIKNVKKNTKSFDTTPTPIIDKKNKKATPRVTIDKKNVKNNKIENEIGEEQNDNDDEDDDDDDAIKIIFTGIEKEEKLVKKIKATIVDDATQATHLISGDDLRRTPKLLIAINSGVKYVLNLNWLIDSSAQQKPIEIKNLQTCKYIIKNKEKEKLWGFNLIETLTKKRGKYADKKIFDNFLVFIADNVCGKLAPSLEEMKSIVESGGGKLLEKMSEIPSLNELKGNGKLFYFISHETIASKTVLKKPIKDIVQFNVENNCICGGRNVYSIEFLFLAVLRQKVDHNCGMLQQK